MNNPLSRNANAGAVTKTERTLKPLYKCACGIETDDKKCAWCRIVADVGYDMKALREGKG